jgi:hypothetical protein
VDVELGMSMDALCPSGEEGHSGSDRSSKANVEQIFSRAGGLTDPNIDQDYLATLVVVGCNKSAFKPSCDAIKAKYFQLFRGKGGEGLEEDKEEADEAGGGSS